MMMNYRMGYLAVAIALMGGVAYVSADSEPKGAAPTPASDALKHQLNDLSSPDESAPGNATSEGVETGNLGEVGARELVSNGELVKVLHASEQRPVLIFKHSTECPISGGAYRRVAAWLREQGDDAPPVYLVKVIERRDVSQYIEATLGVKHESPQVILLDDRKVVWNASHEAIDGKSVAAALAAIASDANS